MTRHRNPLRHEKLAGELIAKYEALRTVRRPRYETPSTMRMSRSAPSPSALSAA